MSKKYMVDAVEFQVHEDSYEHGEGKLFASWDESAFLPKSTIDEALDMVPHVREVAGKDGNRTWKNDPCSSGEHSRFDADLLIDWDFFHDCPVMHVSEEAMEQWREGKRMLYNLHAVAILRVVSELSADDVKDFVNAY